MGCQYHLRQRVEFCQYHQRKRVVVIRKLIENFQSIEAEKVGITFYRPPPFVGMMIQNREFNLLHCALVSW